VEIEQHQVHVAALQHRDGTGAIRRFEHLKALTLADLAQQHPNLRVVVDEEQQWPGSIGLFVSHAVNGRILPSIYFGLHRFA